MQGEPGIGKSTCFAKLVLDWCEAVSPNITYEYRYTFSDVETLKEFGFVFYIDLRNSQGQTEVDKMIKMQIIDMIYAEDERCEFYHILQSIMTQELCIVAMDGLNEWVDPLNKHAVPEMVSSHRKCVELISTRPWKMTDELMKDSDIDKLLDIGGIIDSDELTKHMLRCLPNANQKTYTDFMTYVNERQLFQFLTSPWLQTMLVNLWMDDKALSGSLCELNCILLDRLFKKANGKQGYFIKENPIQCLSNTSYIEPQKEILDALGQAAFHFTLEKAVVFTKRELMIFLSEEQFQFCLNAGILTEKCSSTQSFQNSQISFLHETMQEFLAAYHIAHLMEDELPSALRKYNYNVLEMSQTFIYLCGLNIQIANKAIQLIISSDFFNDVNMGPSVYLKECVYHTKSLVFQKEKCQKENKQKFVNYESVSDRRCIDLFASFQRMLIAGYIEAKACRRNENDICIQYHDFIFNQYLNETESSVLKTILVINKADIRTLITEHKSLQTSEILTVIRASTHCLERVEIPATPELCYALHGSKIKELALIDDIDASLVSKVISSMYKLTFLKLKESSLKEEIHVPVTIQSVCLFQCECLLGVLQRFFVELSALKHETRIDLGQVKVIDCEVPVLRSYILECDMSNMTVSVNNGSIELYNLLRDTSIGCLKLETGNDLAVASDILPTLIKLKTLDLWGAYKSRCNFLLPASLQVISLQTVECSSESLCSLLTTLSSINHPVTCELWNVVVLSNNTPCGDASKTQVSDFRSEILSCDMSNITIVVEADSIELFEMLRDTSIGILDLQTSERVLQASNIIHTLHKLETLELSGNYMSRCNFQLPDSLKVVSLNKVECSSEWLCSLLITLSSLHRPVECELWNVVLQSKNKHCGDASETQVFDLRSELLSCDMSNTTIFVNTVSNELFEIFRDTSIGILDLQTSEYVSQASDIIPTLRKLKTLGLSGTYMSRFDLQLPDSLQCIILKNINCSSEWLFSLMFTLTCFQPNVTFEMWNIVLQSSNNSCDVASELLEEESFSTACGMLGFRTPESGPHASSIIAALDIWGTYMSRCDIRLPASLQCIRLHKVECLSEWICSLLTTLSSLHRPVTCVLLDVVLQSSNELCGAASETQVADLRSKLLSCDMSNINILLKTVSIELFEMLRDTCVRILDLNTSGSVSQLSDITPKLTKLGTLYVRGGIFMSRCDFKLPPTFQQICIASVECSSEWLCSLFITLFALHRPVSCILISVVLQSSTRSRDESSEPPVADLRSEMLSCDMSNITMSIHTVSMELFELVRDTSIGILDLHTSDCVSQASDIIPTLHKLRQLCIRGTYMIRCDFQLPASLNVITLLLVTCSSEWICSLLITLSSLHRPVTCELVNVVVQSSNKLCDAALETQVTDLRSKLLSCDMSNIWITVHTVSVELFEIVRYTSIGILHLLTCECVSQASDKFPTLSKLEKLYLSGTYISRCDFQLPASLQRISLQKVECSYEWLCSLLIMLSSIHRPVTCELIQAVLQSNNKPCIAALETRASDFRSEILSYDMSNIEMEVDNINKELFEILRDSSIGILTFRSSYFFSQASEILHTLKKLQRLNLWGTYVGQCDLMPISTLHCVSLQTGECSMEWLCELLIKLSLFNHPVHCEVMNFVLISQEDNLGGWRMPLLRSEMILRDMSNVILHIPNTYIDQYKDLCDANMKIVTFNRTQTTTITHNMQTRTSPR
ncbi:hypothetical protein DPMN_154213 [Dreissena polymorpha]|uniref:NACHT domain-containing protein n=1 Tax=Dreissena polymorpha TaxID=45954 RepID=A0A9D4FN07_DREPO|nr:hypothetical protein DPMN_154213 [Dreissena polymorpha]